MDKNQPQFRVITPVKRNSKTVWLTIGAAWERREAPGYTIKIDLLPTSQRGAMTLVLAPREPVESTA